MKRIMYLLGVISIACFIMAAASTNVTLASCGGCGSEKAHAAEHDVKCAVCGMTTTSEKGITVKCEGKSVTLCSNSCAEAFKKDPCKYCDDERCEKRKKN